MKGYLAFAAVAGAAIASPFPQAPSAPAGCSSSRAGTFGISVVNVTMMAKRDLETRQGPGGSLTITLQDGVLTDQNGRTGCIVANRQFQFDNPIQDNAIYTSGWSVCQNGSLALTSAIFYQCLSGSFYNLYDQSQGGQCNPVYIVATGGAAGSAAPAAPMPMPSGTVAQIPDGQPQATSQSVAQIGDGQIQATTGVAPPPATQIADGQIQAPTGAVSQIGDGQIQAPTGAVSQIGDGQIQAPTGSVTQIGDGQIQAPTGSVTQIGDGQIQAPTGAVTQIGDGQIQAPTGSVTQIGDGQIQAPTGTPAIATYVGAAPRELAGSFAFVAGIVGAIALL